MPRATEFLQRKATEQAVARIPTPVLDAMGRAMLKGIDRAVESRWDRARDRAAEAAGSTVEARARSVTRSFSRELTALGAGVGATAAAPGIGTASALSMLVAEVGWFGLRATDLVMTLGAVYGHVDASAEERRAWVLSVLAFGEKAATEFTALAGEMNRVNVLGGERVGALVAGVLGGDAATIEALREINRELALRVASRYGARLGAQSIGELLPFGIGAVVGGSANWALTRALSKQARRFFAHYPLVVIPPPARIPPPPTGPMLSPPGGPVRPG